MHILAAGDADPPPAPSSLPTPHTQSHHLHAAASASCKSGAIGNTQPTFPPAGGSNTSSSYPNGTSSGSDSIDIREQELLPLFDR